MIDRQKLSQIFKASPTPTSIVSADDPNFTFLQVNEAYTEMTQTKEEDLIGKSLFEIFPENPEEVKPTGVERLRNSFRKVIAEKSEHEMDQIRYDIKLDDNEYKEIYWKVTNTPVLGDDDEVEFIINSAQNITDEVLSERSNNLMLNNTEDSFILIDKNLIVQNFNASFAKHYQDIFDIEVVRGVSILEYAQPERYDIVKQIYDRVFKGETIEGELPFVTQDGNTRFFTIKYKPAKDEDGKITGSFISLLEKTEEHIAKLDLKKNEARFRALVEHGNDVLFILTPEGEPTYISPSIENVLGYTHEEAYNIDLMEVVHPDDVPIIYAELEKCMNKSGETIEVAPARMRHKNGQYRWMEGTITNMLHDPSINGIVDNFRDITDRVVYQEKLEVQRRKTKQILDQSVDMICTARDGKFLTVSAASEKILGYKPEEMVGKSFNDFIVEDETLSTISVAKYVKNENVITDFENRYYHKNGHIVHLTWAARWDKKENKMYAIARDATDLKAAQQAKERERRNKEALINSTDDVLWSIDSEMKIITANQSFLDDIKEQSGVELKPGDHVLKGLDENLEYQKNWEEYYRRALSGESFRIETHASIDDEDVNYWYETSFNPIYTEDKITGVACFARDISEAKKAQMEIRLAEDKLRNVVEYSTNMFYQHDTEGILTYVSPQSVEFLGYTPEEAKKDWHEFITDHPINNEGEKLTLRALETGEIQEPYELQLITKDNRIIWVEVHEAPFKKDGKVVGIVGSLTDITDRKKYEKKLKQSLERYDYVSKASRDAIYDWDITNNTLHWGEGFATLFGHKAGKNKYPMRNWEKLIHSDDLDETKRGLKFTLEDSSMNKWTSEYRLKKAKDGYAHVLENGYIIRNDDGIAIRMIGALRDVSESKQTEIQNEIQREVSELFKGRRSLNEILTQVITYLADYGNFETAEIWLKSHNEAHQNLIANLSRTKKGESFFTSSLENRQFKKGEGFQGTVWNSKEIEAWDDINSSPSFVRSKAASKAGIKSAFGIPLFHNEDYIGVLLFSSAAKASANKELLELFEGFQHFLGAEIKRKQQEEEFQLLFENAPEILAFAAPNGHFVRVNPAFCDLLGYTEEELTTQPFDKFIHPDDREATLEGYYETNSNDRHANKHTNRYITKSGETVHISWSSSEIFGEDGLFFAYGRDVTETVELEQLLQLTNRLAKVGSWELDLTKNNKEQKVYWSDMTREIFEVADTYDPNFSEDLELFQPDSRQILQDAVQTAIEKGESYDLELAILSAKGNQKWIRCIGSAEFINGTCKRIYGSIQDITERKDIQKKIKETNKKLKVAQVIAKLGYWELDLNTNELFWSDEIYRIWELEGIGEPLTFEKFRSTIHPDDLHEFDKHQEKALSGEEELNIEHRILLPDKTIKWVHEIGNLSKDEKGNIRSYQGTVQDVTAQKMAKLEIEETLKEKETILESIEDGFFTVNKNWIVTYWNRAAERMLQTAKQDIVEQNLWDVFDEAIDLPSYTNYHRAMHQNINVDFEDYYPAVDKWFDISAYPSPDGISVFFKDITERKRASEKLEQLNAELKQRADELATSNAELEQFAYVASHDLQEPLRMVTSFLTQLDKKYSDKLDEKANEYIHYAVDGAQRMRQIILDLLNYSRLNKDQQKQEKTNLNKLLKDAKSLERSHIMEAEAEIINDKLPTLKVNPGALKQVFQNLLNNAIKYHKPGVAPKITIRAKELDTHWKFSFEDNGIGINEEFNDTIFQIFQRLHTRDHYSGTGIGLAISKKILERHGGEIWVESEEGKGSTFYFTLKK